MNSPSEIISGLLGATFEGETPPLPIPSDLPRYERVVGALQAITYDQEQLMLLGLQACLLAHKVLQTGLAARVATEKAGGAALPARGGATGG